MDIKFILQHRQLASAGLCQLEPLPSTVLPSESKCSERCLPGRASAGEGLAFVFQGLFTASKRAVGGLGPSNLWVS